MAKLMPAGVLSRGPRHLGSVAARPFRRNGAFTQGRLLLRGIARSSPRRGIPDVRADTHPSDPPAPDRRHDAARFTAPTQISYIRIVRKLHGACEAATKDLCADGARAFLLHLQQDGVSVSTINSASVALRFFLRATLGHGEHIERIPVLRESHLPARGRWRIIYYRTEDCQTKPFAVKSGAWTDKR